MEYYDTSLISKIEYPVTELPSPPLPQTPQKRDSGFWRVFRRQVVASVLLGGAILTMGQWWPQGLEKTRSLLVCAEIGPVEAAAQTMLSDILQGEPLPQAVSAFCQEVYACATD